MTDPKPEGDAAQAPVLRQGAEFEGLVVVQGRARIEGCVRGEVIGAESLEIASGGRVEGRVEADEVVVAGSFEGELRARRRARLETGARVRGDVRAPRLSVAEGSQLDGPCRAGAQPEASEDASPEPLGEEAGSP
jgi:cytoskeletal protein CcmA (bactofilin family)